MEAIIQIQNLSYSYHSKVKALDNISITVPKGAIYGFLGPNGAGKSTTMRMLSGIMPDETNAISIFEKPIQQQLPKIYSQIGCLVEQPVLYNHLTAKDHLDWIIKSNDLPKNKLDETLDLVRLSDAKYRKVKQYSLGMKQRLAIALCLIKEPKLLLLDEPVNGLDPNGMQEIRNILTEINQQNGVSIFISSHLLAEIEKMCTHIGIIRKGKIYFEGTMDELQHQFKNAPLEIKINPNHQSILLPDYTFRQENENLIFNIQTKSDIPKIIYELSHQGVEIFEVKQTGNLESWFMDIVN